MLLRAFLAVLLMGVASAQAQTECPHGAASCKIVIITPEEEGMLAGPEGIFDHAVWANRVKFGGLIDAWRQKLAASPQGQVKPAQEKK